MKVVLSTSHGGFRLPERIARRCLELGMTTMSRHEARKGRTDADFVDYGEGNGEPRYVEFDGGNPNRLRCDPRLVQAVEEYRDKGALRYWLKVIDIPFDSPEGWEIISIDGKEFIVDSNRVWGREENAGS